MQAVNHNYVAIFFDIPLIDKYVQKINNLL